MVSSPAAPPGRKKWRRSAARNGKVGNRPQAPGDAAATLARKERRTAAYEQRLRGVSIAAIAASLGISERQAKKDIKRRTEEVNDPSTVLELRRQQLDALRAQVTRLNLSIEAARADANRKDATRGEVAEARRAHSMFERTLRQVQQDITLLTGTRVPVTTKVEHTGASGGPIEMTLDALEGAFRAGRENADAVDGEREPTEH